MRTFPEPFIAQLFSKSPSGFFRCRRLFHDSLFPSFPPWPDHSRTGQGPLWESMSYSLIECSTDAIGILIPFLQTGLYLQFEFSLHPVLSSDWSWSSAYTLCSDASSPGIHWSAFLRLHCIFLPARSLARWCTAKLHYRDILFVCKEQKIIAVEKGLGAGGAQTKHQ